MCTWSSSPCSPKPQIHRATGSTWLPTHFRQLSSLAVVPIAILLKTIRDLHNIPPVGKLHVIHTIEICGSDKGDVDTEIAVIRGAIKTEIDTERNGRPCRVLGAAVEAYLHAIILLAYNAQIRDRGTRGGGGVRTLFAGFNFSFSKIF